MLFDLRTSCLCGFAVFPTHIRRCGFHLRVEGALLRLGPSYADLLCICVWRRRGSAPSQPYADPVRQRLVGGTEYANPSRGETSRCPGSSRRETEGAPGGWLLRVAWRLLEASFGGALGFLCGALARFGGFYRHLSSTMGAILRRLRGDLGHL